MGIKGVGKGRLNSRPKRNEGPVDFNKIYKHSINDIVEIVFIPFQLASFNHDNAFPHS